MTFKPDLKKYAELAKPFDSEEEAERCGAEFLNAVARLREQYRIPELTIQFQAYVRTEEGILTLRGGGGWGDQLEQAKLAKRSADVEFESLCVLLEKIAAAMPRAQKMLITDPVVVPREKVKDIDV